MVIIVKTPLQIICAVEYLHSCKAGLEKARFIYLKKYDLADNQVKHTFDYYGITNQETIRFSNSNVMRLFGRQILLAKFKPLKVYAKARQVISDRFAENKLYSRLQKAHTIVLGDPNFKLFGKVPDKVSGKEIVLLDDGLGSMEIGSDYSKNGNKAISFSFLRTGQTIRNAGTVLENNFEKLKSSFPEIDANAVLFIGQPLYEAKLFSMKEMSLFFRQVSEKYQGKRILYIPHRWEVHLDKMDFPSNFEALPLQDLPLELSITQMDSLPAHVISFYSSALITLRKILPAAVGFTALDIQSEIKLEAIGKAYEKIASFGISVTPLEPVKPAKA